jgi:endonuclease-8
MRIMEGPSVKIAADTMSNFVNKTVESVSGNTSIDKEVFLDAKVLDIFSRGKNLFIEFDKPVLKIHFGMYGTWRVNEEREGKTPRLGLQFSDGMINLYYCSVKIVSKETINKKYPEERDILSPNWILDEAIKMVRSEAESMICDVLLDQEILPGVGNIIKNEALYKSSIHPESIVEKIPPEKMLYLLEEARDFSIKWYKAKKREEKIFPHLSIYRKSDCPEGKVTKKKTGNKKRWSYICPNQEKYA